MDDVYVVVGLLLFGSLLFCLCCYKVSNLLYMLYHIDDSTSDDDLLPGLGFGSGAVGALAAAKDSYSFATAYRSMAAGEGGDGSAHAKLDDTAAAALLMSEYVSNEQMQGNHVGNMAGNFGGLGGLGGPATSHFAGSTSMGVNRHPSQQQHPGQLRGMRQAGSVTSLSVGVQVTPEEHEVDMRTSSETCLIPHPGSTQNVHRQHHQHHQHHQQQQQHYLQSRLGNHHRGQRSHLSNPDFRHASVFDVGSGNRHRTGGDSHYQSFRNNPSAVERPLNPHPSAGGDFRYRGHGSSSSYQYGSLGRSRHRQHTVEHSPGVWYSSTSHHSSRHRRSPSPSSSRPAGGGGGGGYAASSSEAAALAAAAASAASRLSGVRSGEGRTVPPHHHHHHHHHPPPSSIPSSNTARRYGSIRVAECSFIEHHHDESPRISSSSPPSRRDSSAEGRRGSSAGSRRGPPPPVPQHHHHHAHYHHQPPSSSSSATHHHHVPSSYNPYSTAYDAVSPPPPPPANGTALELDYDGRPRSPSPPIKPSLTRRTVNLESGGGSRQTGKQHPSEVSRNGHHGVVQCNGPRSLPGVVAPTPDLDNRGGGDRGPEAPSSGQGHIIPPPQNFEDFQRSAAAAAAAAAAPLPEADQLEMAEAGRPTSPRSYEATSSD